MDTITRAARMTPADLHALTPEDARSLYAALRDELAREYATRTGPRARRSRTTLTAARAAAGKDTTRDESALDEAEEQYRLAAEVKTALAVRLGRLGGATGSDRLADLISHGAARRGRPLATEGETADLRIRVPRDLLVAIDAAATTDSRSRDAWIRRACAAEIERLRARENA